MIKLQVNNTLQVSASQVTITADNPSINVKTSLNFEIRTTNPYPPKSSIKLTIPADFDISGLNVVTGDGAQVKSQIEMVLDTNTRTLTMKDINDSYI